MGKRPVFKPKENVEYYLEFLGDPAEPLYCEPKKEGWAEQWLYLVKVTSVDGRDPDTQVGAEHAWYSYESEHELVEKLDPRKGTAACYLKQKDGTRTNRTLEYMSGPQGSEGANFGPGDEPPPQHTPDPPEPQTAPAPASGQEPPAPTSSPAPAAQKNVPTVEDMQAKQDQEQDAKAWRVANLQFKCYRMAIAVTPWIQSKLVDFNHIGTSTMANGMAVGLSRSGWSPTEADAKAFREALATEPPEAPPGEPIGDAPGKTQETPVGPGATTDVDETTPPVQMPESSPDLGIAVLKAEKTRMIHSFAINNAIEWPTVLRVAIERFPQHAGAKGLEGFTLEELDEVEKTVKGLETAPK